MMTEKVILSICSDPELAGQIARDLDRGPRYTLRNVANIDEAGDMSRYALIVLYLDGCDNPGQVDALLWAILTTKAPVPVLALSAVYNEAEALMFFQMGVTEYLSLNDHRCAIRSVVRSIVSPQDVGADDVVAEYPLPARELTASRAVAQIL